MTHWKNSAFQTLAFVVARCHTADEAFKKVMLAADDRKRSLEKSQTSCMRMEARLEKAKYDMENAENSWERKEAEASVVDIENDLEYTKKLAAGARTELAFLRNLLDRIDPYRKYKHMGDDGFEAAQREEWLYEFIRRAQNSIWATGTIPPTQLDAMRSHPDFNTAIYPTIESLLEAKKSGIAPSVPSPDTSFKQELEQLPELSPGEGDNGGTETSL